MAEKLKIYLVLEENVLDGDCVSVYGWPAFIYVANYVSFEVNEMEIKHLEDFRSIHGQVIKFVLPCSN